MKGSTAGTEKMKSLYTAYSCPKSLRRFQSWSRQPLALHNSFCFQNCLIALHVKNIFTVIVERKEQVPFSMAIENGDSCRSVLPNTCEDGKKN